MERIIHGDVLSPILGLIMRSKGATQGYFRKYSERQGNSSFSILAYNPVFEIKFENGVLYQNGQVI